MNHLAHTLRLFSLCLLAIGLLPNYAIAQDVNKLKAALTYNFSKFTQWPEETTIARNAWKLCYIGEQYRMGFKSLDHKKLADKLVTTYQLKNLKNIAQCHIVYIGSDNRAILPRLFIALDNNPILTISDISGFIGMGGMIEITQQDNRLKFKVNLKQLEHAQLSLSSKVLKHAVEVKR